MKKLTLMMLLIALISSCSYKTEVTNCETPIVDKVSSVEVVKSTLDCKGYILLTIKCPEGL